MVGFFKKNSSGFSLVEMMVVIAIFFIITAVTLANLPDFQNKTSMDLVAQDVALAIRTAQVYSTATRKSKFESVSNPFPSYGVNFDISEDNSTKISVYSDVNGLTSFNPGSIDSNLEKTYDINGKAYIKDIFYGPITCSNPSMNIFFKRPNTDVLFFDGCGNSLGSIENVIITLSNKRADEKRYVIVHKNGQIEVQRSINP